MPFGAANENSHLVETHFTFGQAKYTARDLGTLQGFAGGREYLDRLVGISLRRRFASDHVSLQRIELRKCFGGFRREGQFEPFRGGGFERVRELLLEAGAQTQADEQKGTALDAAQREPLPGAADLNHAILKENLPLFRPRPGRPPRCCGRAGKARLNSPSIPPTPG